MIPKKLFWSVISANLFFAFGLFWLTKCHRKWDSGDLECSLKRDLHSSRLLSILANSTRKVQILGDITYPPFSQTTLAKDLFRGTTAIPHQLSVENLSTFGAVRLLRTSKLPLHQNFTSSRFFKLFFLSIKCLPSSNHFSSRVKSGSPWEPVENCSLSFSQGGNDAIK